MQVGASSLGVQWVRVEGIVDEWISGLLGVPCDSRPFVDPGWAYQVDTTRLDEQSTHADQLRPLHYQLTVRPASLGWSSFEFHPCVKEWDVLAIWAFHCQWEEAKQLLEQATKNRERPEHVMECDGIMQLASDLKVHLEHGPDNPMKELVSEDMKVMACQWALVAALAALEGDIRRETTTQQEGASVLTKHAHKKNKKKAAGSKKDKVFGMANASPLPSSPSPLTLKAGPAATNLITPVEHWTKWNGLPSVGFTHAGMKDGSRHSHASKQPPNPAGCSSGGAG